MADRVLEFDRLSRRYADVVALQDLSFHVQAGELFGFVGSNGALFPLPHTLLEITARGRSGQHWVWIR